MFLSGHKLPILLPRHKFAVPRRAGKFGLYFGFKLCDKIPVRKRRGRTRHGEHAKRRPDDNRVVLHFQGVVDFAGIPNGPEVVTVKHLELVATCQKDDLQQVAEIIFVTGCSVIVRLAFKYQLVNTVGKAGKLLGHIFAGFIG